MTGTTELIAAAERLAAADFDRDDYAPSDGVNELIPSTDMLIEDLGGLPAALSGEERAAVEMAYVAAYHRAAQ